MKKHLVSVVIVTILLSICLSGCNDTPTDILTLREVRYNRAIYINTTITVEGFYVISGNSAYIKEKLNAENGSELLEILRNMLNVEDHDPDLDPVEEEKYRFTGRLLPKGDEVYIDATEIVPI